MVAINTIILALLSTLVLVSASKSGECDPCKYDYECETHNCHQGKCTWRNHASFSKCFADLCEPCKVDYDCMSQKCYKYRCVPKLNLSYIKKCIPKPPKPSASSTTTATATPTPSTTSTPTPTSSPTPSPKKEDCEPCTSGYDCISGKCSDYLCGTPDYVKYYCPKDECAECKYDVGCKSGKCKHGYCYVNRHSIYKCNH